MRLISCLVAVSAFSAGWANAQDKIILKDGGVVQGEIQKIDQGGNITIKFERGTIPYPKTNIESVELAERDEYKQGVEAVLKGDYDRGISLLQPVIDKYLGIESGWVADAGGYLAEALAAKGKTFDSEQLSDKIIAAYPKSVFRFKGMVGKANVLVAKDKLDEAMAMLDEVEKDLNSGSNVKVMPDRRTMRILNHLYFLKAQIEEKKGQKQQALEHYLKVVTLYYEPANRAAEAQSKADALRKADSKLMVN